MKLFLKRFLLIITGVVLSLVVLECGLRLAGWTISSYQCYKNDKILKNKSKYRIMCLGESTTAGQYPVQLQKILDKKYPNKFSVIDCGVPGTLLQSIFYNLDDNIQKYSPDIAICMMGINDIICDGYDSKREKNFFYTNNVKIYKLFLLIKENIKNLLKEKFLYAQTEDNDVMSKVILLKNSGHFSDVEKILLEILRENPDNETAFVELSVLYSDYLKKEDFGYSMAKEALNKGCSVRKERYYNIIFKYNRDNSNKIFSEFKYYLDKAVFEDIDIFSTEIRYFLYGFIKDYISLEQKNKILQIMNKDNKDYNLLAINAIEQKEYQKAREYFNKAEEERLTIYNSKANKIYNFIVKKLTDNNIKVICMQYPVRSVKPLQEQLKDEPYYDKITFISNEKLFKDALMKKDYNEIFSDQFAGDFGHCTSLGNTMIAKNIVNILEKIIS